MDVKDLISILIPAYNVERYIAKCLDCVLGQTYAKIEVIVIDDGSTDETAAICDTYASKDSRIQVYHTQNQGVAAARNLALSKAKGNYIAFVDSDDTITEDFIEHMVQIAIDYQVKIVRCDFCYLDETSKKYKLFHQRIPNPDIRVVNSRELLMGELTVTSLLMGLYRREIWEGITFPNVRTAEDTAVIYHLLYPTIDVALTPRVLYCVSIHEDSLIGHGNYSLIHIDKLDVLEEKMKFWRANNETELARITLLSYTMDILTNMLEVKRLIKKSTEKNQKMKLILIWKSLRSRYRTIYKDASKQANSLKQKGLFTIAYFQPDVWKVVQKI